MLPSSVRYQELQPVSHTVGLPARHLAGFLTYGRTCNSGMLGRMTEPQFSGSESGSPYTPPPQQPGYPPPGQYPPPPGLYGPPPGQYTPPAGQYPPAYMDPAAPFGRHPVTGEPLSDKSKVVAGLLQLLGLLGLLGIGRMYMGQVTFGVLQLVGCLVFAVVTCGIGYVVPVVWGIIDAVVLMTGTPRDQYGRLLRDGG